MLAATIENPKQDYLTRDEILYIKQNPGLTLHIVTLVCPFGEERSFRLFIRGTGFAAVKKVVDPLRRELGLQNFEMFEALPVTNAF